MALYLNKVTRGFQAPRSHCPTFIGIFNNYPSPWLMNHTPWVYHEPWYHFFTEVDFFSFWKIIVEVSHFPNYMCRFNVSTAINCLTHLLQICLRGTEDIWWKNERKREERKGCIVHRKTYTHAFKVQKHVTKVEAVYSLNVYKLCTQMQIYWKKSFQPSVTSMMTTFPIRLLNYLGEQSSLFSGAILTQALWQSRSIYYLSHNLDE